MHRWIENLLQTLSDTLAVYSEPDGHRGKRLGPESRLDLEASPDSPFCPGEKTKAAPPRSQTEGVFQPASAGSAL